MKASIDPLNKAWYEFIDDSANWTVAFTVNFRRLHQNQLISIRHMTYALRHFLRVLDCSCLGNNKAKRGAFVNSVVVHGWGTYNDHPHAHLALECPKDLSDSEFEHHILQAASKTIWFAPKPVTEKYRDAGWSVYMVGHGPENCDADLFRIHQCQVSSHA
jgi:hypothetical protein